MNESTHACRELMHSTPARMHMPLAVCIAFLQQMSDMYPTIRIRKTATPGDFACGCQEPRSESMITQGGWAPHYPPWVLATPPLHYRQLTVILLVVVRGEGVELGVGHARPLAAARAVTVAVECPVRRVQRVQVVEVRQDLPPITICKGGRGQHAHDLALRNASPARCDTQHTGDSPRTSLSVASGGSFRTNTVKLERSRMRSTSFSALLAVDTHTRQ